MGELNGRPRQHDDSLEKITPEDQQRHRSRWSAAIETFSPVWFTLVMNTGILSIQLHQLPYQFPALHILSTILYVFSLVLFVVVFSVQLLRLAFYPRSMLRQTAADHEQACLWGCCPISFMTLTAETALIVSGSHWGGHAFAVVSYVMWWICTLSILTSAMVVYIFLCKSRTAAELKITATMFIPAVGTTTDALVGGILAAYATDLSAQLAVPMIVVSYIVLGLGFFVALVVYVVFLFSLLNKGVWLPPAKYPGFLLLSGPMGQTAAAILQLATAAERTFGTYKEGQFFSQETSSPLATSSVMWALMFVGFDLFWLMFGLYFIAEGATRRQIPFTMTWWSTIFPVATLGTTWISLSVEMDSPTFRVLATAWVLILLVDYFICWAFTIWGVWKGNILDGREMLAQMTGKES